MKKRLDLACGLLHRPEVLVLDEPSLGLDVQSRHRIWDHVREQQRDGVTVLLATNYLDEADRLCNRLTIIDDGRAVVSGSPAELKRGVGADVVQVSAQSTERLREAMAKAPWVKRIIEPEAGQLHLYVEDASSALPAIMQAAIEHDAGLQRITYSEPTLDDVFLLHTGRELREGEAAA
jgi:ABC-2 type transport system ATP-binding protein